jgi:hypothetical protein
MRIHFEDHGQDFLTFQLNNAGVIVDCTPFQSFVWVGQRVKKPHLLKAGDRVALMPEGGQRAKHIRYRIKAIEQGPTADEFNARYAVGSPCRYYPIAGDSSYRETKTRTPAWVLGHGDVVVSVEGIRGGVDVNHLVMEG